MSRKISMKAARVNAGLTQDEMAEKMGVSRRMIIDWEAGKRPIKTSYFISFCHFAGFETQEIFLPGESTESEMQEAAG